MTTRCALCRRTLRAPSPDGYGPVCRRKLQPAGPTPGTADVRPEPGHGQLAIPVQTAIPGATDA